MLENAEMIYEMISWELCLFSTLEEEEVLSLGLERNLMTHPDI
jgi:hypothetical protein